MVLLILVYVCFRYLATIWPEHSKVLALVALILTLLLTLGPPTLIPPRFH